MYGKQEIARRLANELQLTPGAAADEVDRVVAGILEKLRNGRDACLRGVGILHPVPGKRKAGEPRSHRNQELAYPGSPVPAGSERAPKKRTGSGVVGPPHGAEIPHPPPPRRRSAPDPRKPKGQR